MTHDPLDTVLRLRRRAVEECTASLAVGISIAARAANSARAAERAITDEAEAASSVHGDDSLVEAFAAWFPAARQREAQARAEQDRAEAEVGRWRAELAACRTALESIEALRDRRLAEQEAALQAQEQRTLDEAAARPRPEPI